MILPLEKQLTSLDVSRELRNLGVPQESLFYWSEWHFHRPNEVPRIIHKSDTRGNKTKLWSAFTVAELGVMLPEGRFSYRIGTSWFNGVATKKGLVFQRIAVAVAQETEADAQGKMLIYLIKNNLINVKEI